MSVSIVIVNWNGEQIIEKCLNAVKSQTMTPDQVVVVDNNSTDNSIAIIKKFSDIKLIENHTNSGFAAANNLALTHINTDFVALLNPDAFPDKEWLASLVRQAAPYPLVASVGSLQLSAENPDIIDGLEDTYHFSGLFWRNGHGSTLNTGKLTSKPIFSACAAAALYRTRILKEIGGFDEDFFCYGEDVDLGFRLQLSGYSALFCPDAIVYHLGSATTGGSKSDFSIYHGHRNLVWVFLKNMPSPLFWLLLPGHLIMTILVILKFIGLGKGSVILRAKRDAFRNLGLFRRKRKQIQALNKRTNMEIWRLLNKNITRRQ